MNVALIEDVRIGIRRRFTILDVAVRTNLLDTWLDNLFGKGGRWEL